MEYEDTYSNLSNVVFYFTSVLFLYSFQCENIGMCCLSAIPPSDANLAAWIGASGLLFPSRIWIGILMPNPLLNDSSCLPILLCLGTSSIYCGEYKKINN